MIREETSSDAKHEPARSLRPIADAAAHVAAFLMQVTAVGVLINAIYRYALGGRFSLVSELANFSLFVVVFLGLAATHLTGGNVRVELLLSLVKDRQRAFIDAFIVPLGSLLFLGLITYAGAEMTWIMFENGTTTPSRPAILMWPIMAVMPVGCSFLILILAIQFVSRLTTRRG